MDGARDVSLASFGLLFTLFMEQTENGGTSIGRFVQLFVFGRLLNGVRSPLWGSGLVGERGV